MKKRTIINTPSSMGKGQILLLKKSMSKKAYREFCHKYRSTMMLGRNYGTRRMASAKDNARKRKNIHIEEIEF